MHTIHTQKTVIHYIATIRMHLVYNFLFMVYAGLVSS